MQCPICGQDCVESQVFCKTCGARLSDEQDGVNTHALPEGTVIGGQYRVGKVISRGGFGITYEGADTKLKRGVAIKEYYHVGSTRIGKTVTPPHTLTPAEHRKAMEQFKEEAELLSKVNHPQIVKVYNYLEENDTGYIILELLEGKSLEEVLRIQGKMGAEEIKGLILPILKGLEAVHKEGILHRDIKPANIILSSRGGVLIDFGASRQYALGKSMDMAQVLTPGYAPLEQYGSRGEFGPPLDIYAIGAMMYRMITGKEPPSAADLATEAVELELGDSRLEQVIRRCMKTNATMRYPDVGSLWKDIAHQATPQPLPSVGVEALSPAKEKPKKKNTAVLVQLVLVLALIGVSAVLFVIGKGHQLLIDNKRVTIDGKRVEAYEWVNVYVNGAKKPIEIEEEDRQLAKIAGPWHSIRIEILQDGKVAKTFERRFTVGLENSFLLSLQKMVEGKEDWLTPR